MKGKTGPASARLRPILDTYMDSAVALVGCTSREMGRYSCEFDVLVVSKERQPPASLKMGDVFADIVFISEKDALKPANPEHALALALSKPIRDNSLVLSTSSATSAATLSSSAQAASRTRLTSALKTIARAEEALSKEAMVEADLWLLASAYEFAYSLLLSKETLPAPSHLLSQLRAASKGAPRAFEGFSVGAGLDAAGRAGCGARLEGLMVLHDLLRESSKSAMAESEWSTVRSEILAGKARELMTRIELAECYSFLGQELVDDLIAVQRTNPKRTLTSLTTGGNRLIGERLVRQLGLARDDKAVRAGLETLKKQTAQLTKAA
ncbi:MAG: hypothetical protein KGI38_10690 [Thaumarchaeota archaeon]|nr:hypothetical protein [Nitrososphaerota archaeon]